MSPSLSGERPVMSTVRKVIVAVVRFPLDPPLSRARRARGPVRTRPGRRSAAFAGARNASFRGEHPVREAAPAGASPTGHDNVDPDRIEVQ